MWGRRWSLVPGGHLRAHPAIPLVTLAQQTMHIGLYGEWNRCSGPGQALREAARLLHRRVEVGQNLLECHPQCVE